MSKYRILKNRDHCIIQVRWWFFWKYLYNNWSGGYRLTFFKKSANKYGTVKSAENTILRLKEIDNDIKRQKSKYEVIYPKVDSPLYNALNEDDDD
jgi:hypothetical protein